MEKQKQRKFVDELSWRAGYGEAIRRVASLKPFLKLLQEKNPEHIRMLDEQTAWESVDSAVKEE